MIHHRTFGLLAALAAAVALPTDPTHAQEPEPQILSSSDCKSLNRKAKDWFEAYLKYEYEADSPRERRSANRSLTKAKEQFLKDWESKSRKGDPLSSVPDVRAVFENVFPYDRESASGVLKQFKASPEVPGYWLMVPKRYDEDQAYRTVLLIPGYDEQKGEWVQAKDHQDATWGASSLGEETIVMLPSLDSAMDLDPKPDFSKPGEDENEYKRIGSILSAAGQVQRDLNVDRERLFVDAGDGACAFAVRLASYFPNRFAGLVLREPVDVTQELRLGSLTGLPILLISSDDTKDACSALAGKLNELQADSCTVIEGKGKYPFKESQGDVDAWIKDIRRRLTPTRVVIEPNHDAFNDAYWVLLGVTEPLAGLPDEQKPRIVVEADKANNRIKVEARGVVDFMLLLNDDIVDLGKEFTVDVNGTLFKEKRDRSLTFLVEKMQEQFDPTWTFTTSFATTVPKSSPPAPPGGSGSGK